jgi:hypothetical protein
MAILVNQEDAVCGIILRGGREPGDVSQRLICAICAATSV